jgi:hypothetical protein
MEKKFDRSKFKGTKLSKLNEAKNEAKKKETQFYKPQGRSKFHSIEEGTNIFRIMPPHSPEDLSYYACRTAMLKCEVPVYEDGEDTGKTEIKNKKIFVATVHGNEKLRGINKDPIETYIKYVYELAGTFDNKDDRQKFLSPINGFKDAKGNYTQGIKPQTTFVCYAIKDGEIGRLDLYEAYMKEMNKIQNAYDEAEDEELLEDIFSNPDEGYPLIIKKSPSKEKNRKWDIEISEGKLKKGQDWDKFFKENRVTDAQLQEMMELPSLKEMFVDVYSKRDFDLAIEGLQRFDQDNKLNIFENEQFVKEIKEIEVLVPEAKKKDSDVDEAFNSPKAKEFSKIKAKKLLKAYINENYEDVEEEYLEALNGLDEDELREWYNLALKEEELPELESGNDVEVADDVESEEEEQEEEEEEKEDDLSALKNRRRSRK